MIKTEVSQQPRNALPNPYANDVDEKHRLSYIFIGTATRCQRKSGCRRVITL